MTFIQLHKSRSKNGRQFTYTHLVSSVWRGKKKTPKQERIYLGRLDETGREIIISKGFPARFERIIFQIEDKTIKAKRCLWTTLAETWPKSYSTRSKTRTGNIGYALDTMNAQKADYFSRLFLRY